jgi:hypothetical protein
MAKQQVVAELHSYEGVDTSLLVNGRKDGRMWVIITIPDDPKDECVIDCGYHTLADALEVVADIEEFRESAARQRNAAAQDKEARTFGFKPERKG